MNEEEADSKRQYAAIAPTCDAETKFISGIRQRAITALRLRPDKTVLDGGCGTGWCLPMLSAEVQQSGHVIGFEPSPDMLALARVRVAKQNLSNVELIETCGETIVLDCAPDAILFSYTRDLIRSRASLENIFGQAKSGTRIVAVGTKFFQDGFLSATGICGKHIKRPSPISMALISLGRCSQRFAQIIRFAPPLQEAAISLPGGCLDH